MAFIDYIPYDDASPELKTLYEKFGGPSKTPANIVRIAGHNPQAMQKHIEFYRSIMFGPSPLSRDQREMIATVVSALNKCHYWIEHHWNALHSLGNVEASLKNQLVNDYKSADISDKDKTILSYAEKITLEAHTIDKAYIDELKRSGLTEHELHDIVQATSYFNYVNRLADGLGVELEQ